MRFHEHTAASFIPDFVEIQQDSFSTFLNQGLLKELSKINPIIDKKSSLELLFYPTYYKLTRPTCTPTEAILRLKTYVSKLYVPVQLINKRRNQIKLHWFYLCDLPLMAKRGHFIVNGCPRVVVNQIIRSPGIYYQNCVIHSMTTTTQKYYADIIPTTGTWLRLESNETFFRKKDVRKKRVWARMKRVGKLSGFLFFCCFKPKKWNECTNAFDQVEYAPFKNYVELEQIYPFIRFLRNVFFQYYFREREKKKKRIKKVGKKYLHYLSGVPEFDKKKRGGFVKIDPFIGCDFVFEKWLKKLRQKRKRDKKRTKRPKGLDYKKDLEEEITKISRNIGNRNKNETIEQILENETYPFAFLFFESREKIPSIEAFIQKNNSFLVSSFPVSKEVLVSLKHKKYKDYSTEEYVKMGCLFLFTKFFNTQTYNLGLMGRLRLNKKFGLNEKKSTLTHSDIFYALNHLFIFQNKKWLKDEIDNLKNKRVKASGELIENQLTTGLLGLKEQLLKNLEKMRDKGIVCGNLNIDQLVTTKPIHGVLRVFFGLSPLSQYLDQTNPLADITHKRRVSCLGPGGLSRETAGMAVRNIHPTHYGRICPIETPEGRNAGLVNSVALYGRINFDGYLQTPFYNVYQGQIQKKDCLVDCQRPTFFSAEQEAGIALSAGDLKFGKLNFSKIKSNPIKSKIEYFSEPTERIEYIAMSPIQMISVATSLIPFLKHDDATRGLMGSNMQRQSIPTIFPERPIVGTGLEARVAAESGHVVYSKSGGYVSYASGKQIVILEKKKQTGETETEINLPHSNKFLSFIYSNTHIFNKTEYASVYLNPYKKNQIRDRRETKSFYPFYPLPQRGTKILPRTPKKITLVPQKDKTQSFWGKEGTGYQIRIPWSCKVLTAKGVFFCKKKTTTASFIEVEKQNCIPVFKSQNTLCYPKKRFYKKINENYPNKGNLTEKKLKQQNLIGNQLQQIKQVKNNYNLNSCLFQYKTCQDSFEKIKDFRFLSTSFFQGKVESTNSFSKKWAAKARRKSFSHFLSQSYQQSANIKLYKKAYTENLFFLFFLSLYNSKLASQAKKVAQLAIAQLAKKEDAQDKNTNLFSGYNVIKDAQAKNVIKGISYVSRKETGLQKKNNNSKKTKVTNYNKKETEFLIVKIFLFFNILQTRLYPFYLPFRSRTNFLRESSYFFKDKKFYFLKDNKKGKRGGTEKRFGIPSSFFLENQNKNLDLSKDEKKKKERCGKKKEKQDLSQQHGKKKKRDVVDRKKKQLQAPLSLIKNSLSRDFSFSTPSTPSIFCNVTQKKTSRSTLLRQNILYNLQSLSFSFVKKSEKQRLFSSVVSFFLPQKGRQGRKRLPLTPKGYKETTPKKITPKGVLGYRDYPEKVPGTEYWGIGVLGYLSFWETLVLGYWGTANSSNSKDANFVRKQGFDFSSPFLNKKKEDDDVCSKVFSSTSSTKQKTGFRRFVRNDKFLAEMCSYSHSYSLESYRRSNQATCLSHRPSVLVGEWVQKADLLADCASSVLGDVSVGKNLLVAYMPWEGYNFEDAILISERLISDDIYTSLHIERFSVSIRDTKFGLETITFRLPDIKSERLKGLNRIEKIYENLTKKLEQVSKLDERGVGIIGNWYQEEEILVGKITPLPKIALTPHQKLLYDILELQPPVERDTSLRVPDRLEGKINNVEIFNTKNVTPGTFYDGPGCVHIFFVEKLKIQVGDKLSGRHGNKGIVSKIIPRQDMPYLPNGTPIDMVLNPLGVPSRMNVGQVFEALLGLAGLYLNESFKIKNFDNCIGDQASRSLVYSKLYQASITSGENWLFNPKLPGKTRVFDGRTGECFEQSVTVGQSYMLKLIHLVDHKIHARSTGPYSLITQQPVKGRSRNGGQRVGEMEVWALQGFGAAYALQEILTIKSDDMIHRPLILTTILSSDLDKSLLNPKITLQSPETFKVLIAELQSVCVGLELYDKITPINLTDYIFSGEINKTNKNSISSLFFADKKFWKNIKQINKVTRSGNTKKNKISFVSFPFFINKKLDQKYMCFSKKPSLLLQVLISELQSFILIKPYDKFTVINLTDLILRK